MGWGQLQSNDTWGDCVRKILAALSGTEASPSSGLINVITGGGNPVATLPDVIMTGAAIIAIPAGGSGYISAAQGNGASVFVGGSNISDGSSSPRGLEISQLGMSPRLTGPVYVRGTAGDKVGVITT